MISKFLKILGLQPLILKCFLNHQNNFFSQLVRTILVTKYHFTLGGLPSDLRGHGGHRGHNREYSGLHNFCLRSITINLNMNFRSYLNFWSKNNWFFLPINVFISGGMPSDLRGHGGHRGHNREYSSGLHSFYLRPIIIFWMFSK